MTTSDADRELGPILAEMRRRGVTYPVRDRKQFVEEMASVGDPVRFRGSAYDAGFSAGLLPDFMYPVVSEADMSRKVLELLVARGLRPLGDLDEAP